MLSRTRPPGRYARASTGQLDRCVPLVSYSVTRRLRGSHSASRPSMPTARLAVALQRTDREVLDLLARGSPHALPATVRTTTVSPMVSCVACQVPSVPAIARPSPQAARSGRTTRRLNVFTIA